MAKLRIDEGDLLMAFEGSDGSMQWYLDRQTGEVIGLGDDLDIGWDDDEDEEDEDDDEEEGEEGEEGDPDPNDWQAEFRALRRKIYADVAGERYLPIPSTSSNEGFRLMERFAGSQADDRVRNALFDALDRHRPFRSFKDALAVFPVVRDDWYVYQEDWLREEALAWLRSEGIDAQLTRPEIPED